MCEGRTLGSFEKRVLLLRSASDTVLVLLCCPTGGSHSN